MTTMFVRHTVSNLVAEAALDTKEIERKLAYNRAMSLQIELVGAQTARSKQTNKVAIAYLRTRLKRSWPWIRVFGSSSTALRLVAMCRHPLSYRRRRNRYEQDRDLALVVPELQLIFREEWFKNLFDIQWYVDRNSDL